MTVLFNPMVPPKRNLGHLVAQPDLSILPYSSQTNPV